MEKHDEIPQEYVTPVSYVIGWLCVTFGSIPLFIAINDKNMVALFIGLGLLFAAVVLFLIGKHQSRELIKKLSIRKSIQ
ncbi:MAG: hypothetical protein A2Z72_03150 [Omnitrophica bacterium RBG_13_46_9]|nr:MAG: hypothetical protein A2Z72_03150 [Omnitrophica bacterium RBG_13_46_9]